VLAGLGAVVGGLTAAPVAAPGAADATARRALEREVRTLTLERAERAPAAIARDPELRHIARRHSETMYRRDELAHAVAGGPGPAARVARGHRRLFGLISENVAFQQHWPRNGRLAARFLAHWMDSPGHRRNILAPFKLLEVGCYGERERVYCTQLFVREAAHLETPLAYRQRPGATLPLQLADSASTDDEGWRLSVSPVGGEPRGPGIALADGAARLTLPATTGLHQLDLWRRSDTDPRRYRIVGGPWVCIAPAGGTAPDCPP
jgi:hypothetical protein